MAVLDWLLSDLLAWRRRRAGVWFKVEHPYGVQPWEWTQSVPHGVVILKTEVHGDGRL